MREWRPYAIIRCDSFVKQMLGEVLLDKVLKKYIYIYILFIYSFIYFLIFLLISNIHQNIYENIFSGNPLCSYINFTCNEIRLNIFLQFESSFSLIHPLIECTILIHVDTV